MKFKRPQIDVCIQASEPVFVTLTCDTVVDIINF